jgi:hypothetical protein
MAVGWWVGWLALRKKVVTRKWIREGVGADTLEVIREQRHIPV